MNLLWDLYWPVMTVAIVIGVGAGATAFRTRGSGLLKSTVSPRRRVLVLAGAIALVLAFGAAWNGPAGKSEAFASEVDRQARQVLVNYEMEAVTARLDRHPTSRTMLLSGPADDFQRSELARILDELPGVANVRWTDSRGSFTLPLLIEVELAALVSFGLGLLLAYLLELRRRSNAQWRW